MSLVEFDGFDEGSNPSPLVLFLEEDWVAVTGDKETTLRNIEAAKHVIASNEADIVKLRSASKPGVPYCSSQWKGFEKYMFRPMNGSLPVHGDKIDRLAILNAASWMTKHNRERVFGPKQVWSPAQNPSQKSPFQSMLQSMVCAHAANCGWTNNPFLARRSFLKKYIVGAAAADWTNTIEGAINLTPFLWSDRKF